MSQMLADLIAAHKALCHAVAQQNGISVDLPAEGQGVGKPKEAPRRADDHFLTDEEEDRMERELGMDRNPLMEQIVSKQFEQLLRTRPKRQEEAVGEKYVAQPEPPEVHYEPIDDTPPMPLPIVGPKNGKAAKLDPGAILQDFSAFEFGEAQ